MFKEASVWLLLCFALASSEPRVQQSRGIVNKHDLVNHPYLFLRVPERRAGAFAQGFENLEEDVDDYSDDDTMSNDDIVDELMDEYDNDNDDDDDIEPQYTSSPNEKDDDDDDDLTSAELEDTQVLKKSPSKMRTNIKSQHMSERDDDDIESAELEDAEVYTPKQQLTVLHDQSEPFIVPDNFIELQAHTAIDTETGELSLMIPRAVFEAIPPGNNIVAMLGPSIDDSQARANRVIVRRRRRNGFGVNMNPATGGNRNVFLPSGNNIQRRINANNNVRIIRQNVYGRPIVQTINRRPSAQTINRRRLNQG